MALGALVAYVPSAYLSIRQELWSVFAADSFSCVYVAVLALAPGLPYKFKVTSLLVISYTLGLLLLVRTGPFGAGHLFIFAFVFLVALFGDLMAMIAANALALLTHAGIAVASALRLVAWPQRPDSVIVISANFALVSLVLSFAANYLIRGYAAAAAEEGRLRRMLELMLREIEHRVKNNLQVIASIVNLKTRPSVDPRQSIEDIKESLSAISVVQKLLYRREAFYLVDLEELLRSLVDMFSEIYKEMKFGFDWEGRAAELDGDRAVSLGIMCNEIIMNSIKHAYPSGKGGRVSVKGGYIGEGSRLAIEIADEGVGLAPGSPAAASQGLSIIAALARQLGAAMERSGPPGLRYRFLMDLGKPIPDLGTALEQRK